MFTLVPDASGTSTFHFVPFDPAQGAPEMTWKGHAIRTELPDVGTLPHVPTGEIQDTTREAHLANVSAALDAIAEGKLDNCLLYTSDAADDP